MKSLKKSLIFMLIFLLIGVSGCGQAQQTVKEQPAHIVVQDGLGRDIELDKPAERIVSSYGIALHMVVALGAQDRLLGIDVPSQNNAFFKETLPESVLGKTVGSPKELNVEEVIGLKPDLVLVPGRNKQVIESMEARGITVFGVVAEDMDQLKSTMLNIGKAVGKEDTANNFARYYDEVIKQTGSSLQGLKEEEKPSVYIVGPMGVLSTCSKDMYQNGLIELCGGKNVAASLEGTLDGHGWLELSPEQLLKWNPDYIFIVQYSGVKPAVVLEDSRFRQLKAVKNKRVYEFPSELNPWDYPSPQAVLGIQWLSSVLHPDKTKLDMEAEANRFYKQFYGKGFTDMGGKL